MDEILHTGATVPPTCPNILDEGDLLGVDFERLGQPAIVELYSLIFEKDVLVWLVEDLNAHHDKA